MCKFCENYGYTVYSYTIDGGKMLGDLYGYIRTHVTNDDELLLISTLKDSKNEFIHSMKTQTINFCPFCGRKVANTNEDDCPVCIKYLPDHNMDDEEDYIFFEHTVDFGLLGKLNIELYYWVKRVSGKEYKPSIRVYTEIEGNNNEVTWSDEGNIDISYCCNCGKKIVIGNTYN